MQDAAKPTDERVRLRAYHLWERDGRPHGRNDEYWSRALAEIQDEERERHGRDARSRPGSRPTGDRTEPAGSASGPGQAA